MKGVFNPDAAILTASGAGVGGGALTSTLLADADTFWVLRRMTVSQDGNGATDFNKLDSLSLITVSFGGVVKWISHMHPGNGGTSSLGFEAGSWKFDFSPGLYTGAKGDDLAISVGAFGTGIVLRLNYFYQ